MFDRFQICESYFLFLSHYHEGQNSKKYKRLSKLTSYYKPSPLLTLDNASEETKAGYHALVDKQYMIDRI